MYPLSTDSLIHNSDQKSFFALENKLLKRYYSESGVSAKPATLDEYLDKVVRVTLERHKQAGAVAEKFEMAYLRTLDVGNPLKADAAKYYSSGIGDCKALQDYIAIESGRVGIAIPYPRGGWWRRMLQRRGRQPNVVGAALQRSAAT